MPKQAIGVAERRTRQRLVIEDEPALVHGRHEARRHTRPRKGTEQRERNPDDEHEATGPRERPVTDADVAAIQAAHHAIGTLGGRRILVPEPIGRDERDDDARVDQ